MGIFGFGLAFLLTWLGNVLEGNWFYIAICIVVYALISLAWGTVTATVVHNKGYYSEGTKWFWIGIIFNEIGFAFACTKPDLNIISLMNEHYKKQEEEIKSIKEEQQLLTTGILACLKGLQEQGCDGSVNDAIDKIEAHLNKKAHA